MGLASAELSIHLTSDAEIAELAGRYGRPRRATDVLAFALHEGVRAELAGDALGDVVISVERAEAQAHRRRVPLARELRDLLIHGVLHLLGLDHARPAEQRAMRELEQHLRWELARLP